MEDDSSASASSDIYELRNAYTNERFAPELLPHQHDLTQRITKVIEEQEEALDELSGPENALTRTIYQMEIERVKYLMSCYLKTRLEKLQRQALFLFQDTEARSNLSESEDRFLIKYADIYQRHIKREAWDQKEAADIPSPVTDLFRIEMLAKKANLDAHVFCIPTKDVEGAIPLEGGTPVELLQGQVVMMPYAPIRHLITSGDVLLT